MDQRQRGILFPRQLPEFFRFEPPVALTDTVRWFWIPEWRLPDGTTSTQQLLPFPACNLVVEPSGVSFVGPPTMRSERTLEGHGWAVAALLRPAAAHVFAEDLAGLRDRAVPVDAPRLHREIVELMSARRTPGELRRAQAVQSLGEWLRTRVPASEPGGDPELANRLELLLADPEVTRVDQLPELLHTSPRTLQRLSERYFGITPHSMIRRRRLQEGAERLRSSETLAVAALAHELGYADHAHFTKDFKALLGVTPSEYRSRAREPR